METEFGNVDGGTGGKVAEWGTDGDKGMCQAEPTKRGKAEQERNHECGKAEQGRMGTECGNVDGETSGKVPECGTNGDKGVCRAEPNKRDKAEQERNDECGQAEHGRMGTECGNVDGGTVGKVAEFGTDGDKGMCQLEPTKRGKADQERNDLWEKLSRAEWGLSVEMLMGK